MSLPIVITFPLKVAAGAVIGTFVGAHVSAEIGPQLAPDIRRNTYAANRVMRNVRPVWGQIVSAWAAGQIEWCDVRSLAAHQGIFVGAHDPVQSADALFVWDKIALASLPVLEPDLLARHWYRSRTSEAEIMAIASRAGLTRGRLWDFVIDQRLPLPAEQIRRATVAGRMDPWEATRQLFAAGYTVDTDQQLILEPPYGYDQIELYALWNRGLLPDDDALRALQQINGGSEAEALRAQQLRQWLPPPTDLVRMAVRDTFLPTLPGRATMVAEYAEQIGLREAFAAQGIGQTSYVDAAGRVWSEDFGLHTWLAHYRLISPSQAFEMLHRLRPGRTERWAPPGADVQPVLIQDVQALLKQDDLAPQWRDRLAAISYHVVGRIDLRRLYRQGLIDRDELVERNQDYGFTLTDAEALAEWTHRDAAEAARKKRLAANRGTASEALRAYRIGTLDEGRLRETLETAGMTAAEINGAVAGSILKVANDTAAEIIACIRRRFMGGEISLEQTESALHRGGIERSMVAVYIERWTRCLTLRRRLLTHSQIMEFVRHGLLSPAAAVVRLGNLGFSGVDVNLLLAETALDIGEDAARIAKATHQANERAAAQLAKAIADREAATEKMRATLRRLTPVGQLRKWLKADVISVGVFSRRMRAMGYPQDVVLAHLAESGHEEKPVDVETNGEAHAPAEEEGPGPSQ